MLPFGEEFFCPPFARYRPPVLHLPQEEVGNPGSLKQHNRTAVIAVTVRRFVFQDPKNSP